MKEIDEKQGLCLVEAAGIEPAADRVYPFDKINNFSQQRPVCDQFVTILIQEGLYLDGGNMPLTG